MDQTRCSPLEIQAFLVILNQRECFQVLPKYFSEPTMAKMPVLSPIALLNLLCTGHSGSVLLVLVSSLFLLSSMSTVANSLPLEPLETRNCFWLVFHPKKLNKKHLRLF